MTGVTAIMAGMSRRQISVTANDVSGAAFGGNVAVTGTPGTVITGGVPPYTVSWARVSGSLTPVPDSATIQNPTWSAFVNTSDSFLAVWRITVNDSVGSPAATFNINVELNGL